MYFQKYLTFEVHIMSLLFFIAGTNVHKKIYNIQAL